MRTHVTPATVLGLLLGAAAGYSGSSSVVVVRSKVERMKGEGDIDTLDRWQRRKEESNLQHLLTGRACYLYNTSTAQCVARPDLALLTTLLCSAVACLFS